MVAERLQPKDNLSIYPQILGTTVQIFVEKGSGARDSRTRGLEFTR